jgi:hypothetical protein
LFLPGLGIDEEQQRRFELGRRRAGYADARGELVRAINGRRYEQVEALGRRALDLCDDPFERAEVQSFISDADLVNRPLEDRSAIHRDLEAAKSRLDAEKRKREEAKRESARLEDELRAGNRLREMELHRSQGDRVAVDRTLSSVNESFRVRDFERAGELLDQARGACGDDPAMLARVAARQETLAALSKGLNVTREHRGVIYALVPAGTSTIGPPGATRAVRIPEPFWISRSPISVAAWRVFRPKYTCASPYPDHPAVEIPWGLARRYCESVGGRLPTEEEWEYAARGGLEGCDYPWGMTADASQANCASRSTSSEGRFPSNGYGLFDVAGNVWEWCADSFSPRQTARAVRGGCWRDPIESCRVWNRKAKDPDRGHPDVGFRCVLPG